MTIQRMDHVGVVVDDLETAIAFFVELGMELEGEASVEGRWVDRVSGLDNVRVDIAMMRTPDRRRRVELRQLKPAVAVVLVQLANQFGAVGVQARARTSSMSSTANMMFRTAIGSVTSAAQRASSYAQRVRRCVFRLSADIVALAEQLS
ncbi:MAG TPA: VOC family protein [Micromonosporaceae bacterium]